MAVEITLLVPAFVVLLLFVVAVGRMASARLSVQEAAQQAARTLTLAGDPATATDQVRAAAISATTGAGLPCEQVTVTINLPPTTTTLAGTTTGGAGVNVGGAGVGGVTVATVRVVCTVSLADVTGLGLPSTTRLEATATSPIDRHRSLP